MCGIAGIFFREGVTQTEYIAGFFSSCAERGTDGYGLVGCDKNKVTVVREPESITYQKVLDYLRSIEFKTTDHRGMVMMCNARSAPETEVGIPDESPEQFLQPVQYEDCVLVHNGSVSNTIVKNLKSEIKFNTQIDSEAIIHMFNRYGRNMQTTMRHLSGGFAFSMYCRTTNRLYLVCTHAPLYIGYVRGVGFIWNSMLEPIKQFVSDCVGNNVDRCGMNVWEHYYFHEHKPNTITELDLDSGMTSEHKFEPMYIHPTWNPFNRNEETVEEKNEVLVAASGGMDSSTTLAVLKHAGLNPVAVHFDYGQRGQDAEKVAVTNVCEMLDIPLETFDISGVMQQLDPDSMLMNQDAKITTGTMEGVKTLAAWTCARNLMFVTHMIALAESRIVAGKVDRVGISLGINLTEEGVYPDNGSRFLESCIKAAQFGSICGSRMYPMYALANLLKSEQLVLLKHMRLVDMIQSTISCDRPITLENIDTGKSYVCGCGEYDDANKEWVPKCGSGKLAYWASKISGVWDNRFYYGVKHDDAYKDYIPAKLEQREFNLNQIINKIQIDDINKIKLKLYIDPDCNLSMGEVFLKAGMVGEKIKIWQRDCDDVKNFLEKMNRIENAPSKTKYAIKMEED